MGHILSFCYTLLITLNYPSCVDIPVFVLVPFYEDLFATTEIVNNLQIFSIPDRLPGILQASSLQNGNAVVGSFQEIEYNL